MFIKTILIIYFSYSIVFSQYFSDLLNKAQKSYLNNDFVSANEIGLQAYKQAKKEFPNEDTNYINALDNISILFVMSKGYTNALLVYKELGDLYKNLYAESSIKYLELQFNIAYCYSQLSDYDSAEFMIINTKNLIANYFGENSSLYIDALNNLGFLYEAYGRYYESEQIFEKSIRISCIIGDTISEKYISLLHNLANLKVDVGEYEEAENLYLKILDKKEKLIGKQHFSYAITLHNLADLYIIQGRLSKVESILLEAYKIFYNVFGPKDEYTISVMNTYSVYLQYSGRYDEAIQLGLEVVKLRKEILGEDNPSYATALNNLAQSYKLAGQYEKVEPLMFQVIEIRKKIFGEEHPDYAIAIGNLASFYRATGQIQKAKEYYYKSLMIREKLLGINHLDYITSLNNLGLFMYDIGNYEEAEKYIEKSISLFKKIGAEKFSEFISANYNLAWIKNKLKKFNSAKELYNVAIKGTLNYIYDFFPYLNESEKISYLSRFDNEICDFYSFALSNAKNYPDLINDVAQLRFALKGIALSRTSFIKSKVVSTGDSNLIQKYERYKFLSSIISQAINMTEKERVENNLDLNQLSFEIYKIEKDINRAIELEDVEMLSKEYCADDVRNSLKEGECAIDFIEFFDFEEDIFDTVYSALIIRKDLIIPEFVYICTKKELDPFFKYTPNSPGSYLQSQSESKKLYNVLIKPVEKYISGIKYLTISPSGVLHKISFAPLLDEDNKAICEKYFLAYVGNLKDIIYRREKELNSSFEKLNAVVFGGADYDMDSNEIVNTSVNIRGSAEEWSPPSDMIISQKPVISTGKWSYLPGTLAEADSISKLLHSKGFKVARFTGKEAREEIFKSFNGKNSPFLFHISTHGFFFPEPPEDVNKEKANIFRTFKYYLLRSGLIFAGANRVWTGGSEIVGLENGILTAYEVSNLDLINTELVVLSACETGLGDINGGEGVFGLQRAFIIAGAKSLIMSLWKVPDKQTAELMNLFYSFWLSGESKREAFNRAQREMKKKYSAYNWAAFILLE